MVWRNSEHYPDPTAGAALRHIASVPVEVPGTDEQL